MRLYLDADIAATVVSQWHVRPAQRMN